ncbi:hypothetical protein EYF80_009315 [Liparis tanakae]|uniref:Uncharacterized protein n=1 Tax=Liparis tanakae TaxID=230148 RepID=A0A4Z2IR39_9TELE|nr:hypothetical protein EYF80_009315 [Liparis tanakae]
MVLWSAVDMNSWDDCAVLFARCPRLLASSSPHPITATYTPPHSSSSGNNAEESKRPQLAEQISSHLWTD